MAVSITSRQALTAHVSYKWVLGDFVRLNRFVHLLQILSPSEMQYPDGPKKTIQYALP
jgi:hypothetical protein